MKTRFAPSSGIILVPRMELRIVEGLGIFHTLSETSAEMAYEGFPDLSSTSLTSIFPHTHIRIPAIHAANLKLLLAHCLTQFHPRFINLQLPTTSQVQVDLLFIIIMALLHARHSKGKGGRMNDTESLPKKKSQPSRGRQLRQ